MTTICDPSDLPSDQCACRIHKPAEPVAEHEIAYRFRARHNSTLDCQHGCYEGDQIARTTDGDPMLTVSRDLGAIESLHHGLLVQAFHRANARDFPGGNAMVCLGPVASPEALLNVVDTIETRRPEWLDELGDNDDDWEPPLQTLLYWSEALRAEHESVIAKPTPATEATYLRNNLDALRSTNGDSHWSDFTKDIGNARRRLEDLLREGVREERAWVPCMETNCESDRDGGRIYIRLVPDKSGANPEDDGWKCPRCRSRYTEERYRLAAREALARFGDRMTTV